MTSCSKLRLLFHLQFSSDTESSPTKVDVNKTLLVMEAFTSFKRGSTVLYQSSQEVIKFLTSLRVWRPSRGLHILRLEKRRNVYSRPSRQAISKECVVWKWRAKVLMEPDVEGFIWHKIVRILYLTGKWTEPVKMSVVGMLFFNSSKNPIFFLDDGFLDLVKTDAPLLWWYLDDLHLCRFALLYYDGFFDVKMI